MKTLHQAAQADDFEALRVALKDAAEVDEAVDGVTALMLAIGQAAAESVRLLIGVGANVNRESCGSTPLVYACSQGHAEIASILLAGGAEVNIVDADGWTPLMHAAFCGWETVVHVLLDYRADVDLKNLRGQTALDLAVQARQPMPAVILRDCGASMGESTPLPQPLSPPGKGGKQAAHGRVQWISQNARLFYSAIHGEVEPLREILAKSPQLIDLRDDTRQTLLMLAAQNGRYHAAETLLDYGADVEAESLAGRTALMLAVDAGFVNIARLLIRRGARVAGKPMLTAAASREDVEMVRMLLAETTSEARTVVDRDSALAWARRTDRPDIAILIEEAMPRDQAA